MELIAFTTMVILSIACGLAATAAALSVVFLTLNRGARSALIVVQRPASERVPAV